MKIFNSIEEIDISSNTAVALGNFDGVHRGHQELIRRTVNTAKSEGLKSAVFTFANHPRNVIGSNPVKNIIYQDEKFTIFKRMNVDYVFNIPFTKEISLMSPVDYIGKLLIDTFRAKEVYCGFNYRFGHKAAGDVELLVKEGLKRECGIHVMEPYKMEGEVVSSTRVRELIENGEIRKCARFLGRRYTIDGEVVVGNKLGRTIGFPTSNLVIDEEMVSPANGVYITYCTYNSIRYPSITNVGVKPTIGENIKNIETHIFNFDKELYGKNIRVEFIEKMRDEFKFDSIDELKEQIRKDCVKAKEFHENYRG